MATKNLLEVLLWLEDLFDRHGIERSYGGAFARNFYAPPRFTKDLDLLVLMSQIKANAGKLDLEMIRKWARELLEAGGIAELEQLLADFYR